MKTNIRIQEFKDEKLGFGFMTIQILVPTSPGSDYMQPVGHIKFQRILGRSGEINWYGMSFIVDTDQVEALQKMTSLARYIKKYTTWDEQPSKIMRVIGAVEYVVYNSEFIPLSSNGLNLYNVTFLGSLHSRIIAKSNSAALKIMKKKGLEKHDITFKEKINIL